MKQIRKTHCAGVSAMMLLVAVGLYLTGMPNWAAATAAFLGMIGPVLVYLYGDDPPFPEDGRTVITIPPETQ